MIFTSMLHFCYALTYKGDRSLFLLLKMQKKALKLEEPTCLTMSAGEDQ